MTRVRPAVFLLMGLLVITAWDPTIGRADVVPQYGSAQAIVTGQSEPVGVAVGSNNALYWVNWGSGQLLTLPAGSSTPTVLLSGLSNPQGVGVDAAGNVYVSEYFAGSILELKAGTSAPVVLLSGLSYPNYIYVTPSGNIYFITGQTCGTAIEEYDHSTASVSTLLNLTGTSYPLGGLSVDGEGDLYYTRCDAGTLNEIPAGSSIPQILTSVPHALGDQTTQLVGLAVDSAGDVAFCGYQSSVWVLAEGSSTPSTISSVSSSSCDQLAIDPAGDIYYTDNIGGKIWEVPATQTTGPSLRSSSWNYLPSSGSITCGLNGVASSDVLLVMVQSASVQQSSMTVTDSAQDAYSYLSNWDIYHGMGEAYAQASTSGSVNISVTVSAGGAGLSIFCYDIAGVLPKVSTSSGYGTGGGSVSVPTFSTTPNSFVVAEYVNSGPAVATFMAGPGFTLTPGTPIVSQVASAHGNTVGGEFGLIGSSSTDCPITNSFLGGEPQGWGGVCLAFAPSPSPADSVTASVFPRTVSGAGSFTVSGGVLAGSGSASNTAVVVTVVNPAGVIVASTSAAVSATGATGTYSATLVAGGTPSWTGGEYSVSATYGTLNGVPPAVATTSFFYASNAISTGTLTVSSPPVQTSIGGFAGVQVSYTNTYSQSMSAFVWVVVKNSNDQTVGIFVGAMTMNSAQTVAAFVPTFNLASGSYSAAVFATTTSSVAISGTSTVPLSL